MFTHRIAFSTQHQALAIQLTKNSDLPEAIHALGLTTARPVMVLIGGAGETASSYAGLIEQLAQLIAQPAEDLGATIITGGTGASGAGIVALRVIGGVGYWL